MKKFLRILCITSFAAIPLFAQDAKTSEPKEEITIDDVVDLEEPKDEVILEEIATLEEEVTEDIILKNDEEEETNEEIVG